MERFFLWSLIAIIVLMLVVNGFYLRQDSENDTTDPFNPQPDDENDDNQQDR